VTTFSFLPSPKAAVRIQSTQQPVAGSTGVSEVGKFPPKFETF